MLSLVIGLSCIGLAVIMIGISIPLLLGKIKMNQWYGARFKKSFESDELWYKINKYSAIRLIIWSIPILIEGIITLFLNLKEDDKFLLIFLGVLPLVFIAIATIDSYLYQKKL